MIIVIRDIKSLKQIKKTDSFIRICYIKASAFIQTHIYRMDVLLNILATLVWCPNFRHKQNSTGPDKT